MRRGGPAAGGDPLSAPRATPAQALIRAFPPSLEEKSARAFLQVPLYLRLGAGRNFLSAVLIPPDRNRFGVYSRVLMGGISGGLTVTNGHALIA